MQPFTLRYAFNSLICKANKIKYSSFQKIVVFDKTFI